MAEQQIRRRQVLPSGKGLQLPAVRAPFIYPSQEGQGLLRAGAALHGVAQDMMRWQEKEEAKGVQIALNGVQADLAVDFRQLAQDHYNDPMGFQEKATATLKGYVEGLTEQNAGAGSWLEQYGVKQIQGVVPRLAETARVERADKLLASHERLFQNGLSQIEDMAQSIAELPEASSFLSRLVAWDGVQELRGSILESVRLADPDTGKPYFKESFVAQQEQQLDSAIGKSLARGLGHAVGWVGLAGSFSRGELTMQLGGEVVDIRNLLTETERKTFEGELAARASGAQTAANALIASAVKIREKGYPLAEAMQQQVETAVSQYPALAGPMLVADQVGTIVQTLKSSSPVQVQGALGQAEAMIRKDGATPGNLTMLKAIQTVDQAMTTEMPKDELAFGSGAGLYALHPLNPANPESIRVRLDAAGIATETYGQQAVPFTREELGTMEREWEDAPAGARVATLHTLTQMGMPAAMFQRTLEKIGQDSPLMAFTAQMVYERQGALAERVLSGMDVLKANPKFSPAKDDAVLPPDVHRALIMDVNGKMTKATRDATLGLYMDKTRATVTEGFMGGAQPADKMLFDPTRWEESVAEVMGPLYAGDHVGRYGIFLPRGMSAEDFERTLYQDILTFGIASGRTPGLLSGMPTTPDPAGARPYSYEEFKMLDWVTVGPGQYALTQRIGGELFKVTDPDGLAVTVDLRSSIPAVAVRE